MFEYFLPCLCIFYFTIPISNLLLIVMLIFILTFFLLTLLIVLPLLKSSVPDLLSSYVLTFSYFYFCWIPILLLFLLLRPLLFLLQLITPLMSLLSLIFYYNMMSLLPLLSPYSPFADISHHFPLLFSDTRMVLCEWFMNGGHVTDFNTISTFLFLFYLIFVIFHWSALSLVDLSLDNFYSVTYCNCFDNFYTSVSLPSVYFFSFFLWFILLLIKTFCWFCCWCFYCQFYCGFLLSVFFLNLCWCVIALFQFMWSLLGYM